jgi:hypothetical protein
VQHYALLNEVLNANAYTPLLFSETQIRRTDFLKMELKAAHITVSQDVNLFMNCVQSYCLKPMSQMLIRAGTARLKSFVI